MTVLYADDDQEDKELFADALKEILPETKLILASHGKEVLQQLSTTPVFPDYIFLDINMPVMGGKDCLIKLKSMDKVREIPVIMYTTTDNETELQKYLSLGATGCIVKESSFRGIKNSLKKMLTD